MKRTDAIGLVIALGLIAASTGALVWRDRKQKAEIARRVEAQIRDPALDDHLAQLVALSRKLDCLAGDGGAECSPETEESDQ